MCYIDLTQPWWTRGESTTTPPLKQPTYPTYPKYPTIPQIKINKDEWKLVKVDKDQTIVMSTKTGEVRCICLKTGDTLWNSKP